MTMREQLVKRVADLCLQADKEGPNTGPLEDYRKHFHGLMADECIRQMEWARQPEPMVAGLIGCKCGQMHVAGHPVFWSEGHQETEVGERMPLTLAPEDWKP